MRSTADIIEHYLHHLLDESTDCVIEVQRSCLAEQFACVPSQINYVISTRFTLMRGYVVESKRGSGGYVRIQRVGMPDESVLAHIGVRMSQADSEALLDRLLTERWIDEAMRTVCRAIVSRDTLSLPLPVRDEVRARIMRGIVGALLLARQQEVVGVPSKRNGG